MSALRRKRSNERGVALVMVIGAIAVLASMLAEFQEETSAELGAAIAHRDSMKAEYHARSAIHLSRLLLAAEPTMRQALAPLFMMMKRTPPQLPIWEYADLLLGAFNDEEASGEFARTASLDLTGAKNVGLKGGRFELQIVDEDAKINVNSGGSSPATQLRLAQQLMSHFAPANLNRLFEARDEQGNQTDRLQMCAGVLDWADPDEQAYNCDIRAGGAASNAIEDAFYSARTKPYKRKNAPFDSLEELHMVRGINDDLWFSLIDPDPTNPKKRNVTVWGQGTVNVNSANAATLLSLVCAGAVHGAELCNDPTQMASFVSGIAMAKAFSMGAPIFGSPREFITTAKGGGVIGPMLAGLGIKPVKFLSDGDFAKMIATESKVFSIYAVGVVRPRASKPTEPGRAAAQDSDAGTDGTAAPPPASRDTRVKIQAVIDFRPNQQMGLQPTGAGTTTATAATATPGTAAIPQQLANGGRLLYFRIE
jgi:general secretion pathway protein K